jgi:hypothetical protein
MIAAALADFERLSGDESQRLFKSKQMFTHSRREDKVAKDQSRSNREKKKPKAERNMKKSAPAVSPFTPTRLTGKRATGRKFS